MPAHMWVPAHPLQAHLSVRRLVGPRLDDDTAVGTDFAHLAVMQWWSVTILSIFIERKDAMKNQPYIEQSVRNMVAKIE